MKAVSSSAHRAHLDLLLRATLLFVCGVAAGQASQFGQGQEPVGQVRDKAPAAAQPLRPLTAELATQRHGSLEVTQRQRWVF
ncbi:hypothetical protein [Pseudomonas subflava]|uniref:hypothetical protein n=1 Tax=Pseudomonas subflava TaxID=2952933 RepID=UPI0020799FA5|nr:hypothetical protein [Pseudomonas subflava]